MREYIITAMLTVFTIICGISIACSPAKGTAEYHFDQGNKAAEEGRYEDAIAHFDEVIQLSPEHARTYFNRGILYCTLGHYKRGIEDFNEAIRLDPQFAEAYYDRGLAYIEQGKKAEAIADFEKFITLTDDPHWIGRATVIIEELRK